jgi:hypothetical protein
MSRCLLVVWFLIFKVFFVWNWKRSASLPFFTQVDERPTYKAVEDSFYDKMSDDEEDDAEDEEDGYDEGKQMLDMDDLEMDELASFADGYDGIM